MRLADGLSGAAVLLGALLLLWAAAGLPDMPGQRFGPATFPTLIGLAMGAAGLVILWRGRAERPLLDIGTLGRDRRGQAAVLWLLGGLASMPVLWQALGFPLLAAVHSGGLMLILEARPRTSIFWAAAVALLVHLVFTRLLLVPLPAGPLAPLLQALELG